jgi:hypothetical protein
MAGTTGLEPATSAVTGQRSNQLSYVPKNADCILAEYNETQSIRYRYALVPLPPLKVHQGPAPAHLTICLGRSSAGRPFFVHREIIMDGKRREM